MPPMSFSMPSFRRRGTVEMRRNAVWCSGRLTRMTGSSVPCTRYSVTTLFTCWKNFSASSFRTSLRDL